MDGPLLPAELDAIDAYWRAANYLSVGQIYLLANPLLREPLSPAHVKPRLLGHWGTTPGLNFIYVHLNRVIEKFVSVPPERAVRFHPSETLTHGSVKDTSQKGGQQCRRSSFY